MCRNIPKYATSDNFQLVLPTQACGEALEPPLPSVEGRALLRLTLLFGPQGTGEPCMYGSVYQSVDVF